MFRNFIWDFDGMLFDSYPHITAAFARMMREERGKKINQAVAKRLFEKSFADAFAYYHTTNKEHKIFSAYEHDFLLEPIAVPFPGTIATLRGITENGGYNYLYTHRGESVYYYLKHYGVYDLFADFVTSEDQFPAKPAPDAVEHIMRKHGLNKSETVMLGDREIDVMAGKNAGVYGCLFTLEPKETEADFVIGNIAQALCLPDAP